MRLTKKQLSYVFAEGLKSELGKTEGLIWFAGEHIHETSTLGCTVRGAYQSGVDAAASV